MKLIHWYQKLACWDVYTTLVTFSMCWKFRKAYLLGSESRGDHSWVVCLSATLDFPPSAPFRSREDPSFQVPGVTAELCGLPLAQSSFARPSRCSRWISAARVRQSSFLVAFPSASPWDGTAGETADLREYLKNMSRSYLRCVTLKEEECSLLIGQMRITGKKRSRVIELQRILIFLCLLEWVLSFCIVCTCSPNRTRASSSFPSIFCMTACRTGQNQSLDYERLFFLIPNPVK